ncbi:transcriptional regulator, LysR family domain protein [Burkholderia oklahomensis]|uniref:Transcriptional regulator, LysR family domain protein n=1 Tax=Burkholderia oklahomensis TaxID=342113 RepID=A0AAI8BAV8_9BURK|nr:transcriptional regulator, LysR family domain protein [Burkholderia oklahomensis]AOI38276.1 LysR family transcriptional regulator [Burkholderia oklahomensis EO147]KUY48601.1 LysR family transcriptional regulator [Burkholderia oklahomensis EO147]QPS41385.1 LysR family transcriptional regulator [Burkholderia oklahomensis]
MLTAATEGQGVATGDPRISTDRLRSESLAMPFIDMATNGLSYFVVYPPRRAAQPKIRTLADVPIKLAQEA